MAPATIASVDDLRAIERAGPRAWMRFDQVHDALAEVAARFSDRPALTALAAADDPSPRRWTYFELLAEIRRCANLFRDLAGASEPRVALLLPPLPEAWFVLWGAETAVSVPGQPRADRRSSRGAVEHGRSGPGGHAGAGDAAGDIGARVMSLRGSADAADGADRRRRRRRHAESPAARARHDGAALASCHPRGRNASRRCSRPGAPPGRPKLASRPTRNQLHAAWGGRGCTTRASVT